MVAVVRKTPALTVFHAEGEVSVDEFVSAYGHFLEGRPTPLTLWDLTRATIRKMDPDDIRGLARQLVALSKDRRPSGKAAFVCVSDVDFGMARMLGTYLMLDRSDNDVSIAVFRDIDHALAWLGSERSPGEP